MAVTIADPTIYATGLAYSTICSVKPVPINLFTKVRRAPHPNGITDPMGILSGSNTAIYAVLSDGDVLVLAEQPQFNALLWNSFPDAPTELIMILRDSISKEELRFMIYSDQNNQQNSLSFVNPIVVAPFCFNEIEVRWPKSVSREPA
ncbi:hypothetical protein CSW14_07950 [Thermus scotoductus]|uniref:Uncharacterized protein n=1 Tax=Thermus scotoductus TaxID=37636 RepID=A0A430VM95_THESC|nr:hypothetical protein [Thermus scotoductus]RTI53875.1 hypothetical protein CSW14_07950 [Thermus scotoductus]